ncbi:hypothetical protein PLANTIT3_50425 [Plantibacter sp. T3]|nr:hypothetical protein PLANTIT3_50425 [Plantibacter sp. T3]
MSGVVRPGTIRALPQRRVDARPPEHRVGEGPEQPLAGLPHRPRHRGDLGSQAVGGLLGGPRHERQVAEHDRLREPLIEHRRVDLEVELRREDPVLDPERLVRRRRRRCEDRRSIGSLDDVAVPVQHRQPLAPHAEFALGQELDVADTHFMRGRRVKRGSEGRRDELMPETDPEHRDAEHGRIAHQLRFEPETRVLLHVERAHRATEEDEPVEPGDLARRRQLTTLDDGVQRPVDPRRRQHLAEHRRSFPGDVLQDEDVRSGHRRPPGRWGGATGLRRVAEVRAVRAS